MAIHQQDDDSDIFVRDCEFNGCIRTLALTYVTPNYDRAHLGVVRCILAQPEQVNDWRRTAIFQTCIKIREKSCKVIVDRGNCINVITSKLITTLGMKPVKHPNPYKVMWIDTIHRCSREISDSYVVCHVYK